MSGVPKCCGDCEHRKKINPEEDICKLDNHVFEDTLSVLIARRDRKCPYDVPKPSKTPRWCAWIMKRFGM